jgi:preprotein translocase subunit SecA
MHFESRKNVLKYDDVLNTQREKVYAERRLVLEGQDISDLIREWIDETVWNIVEAHSGASFSEEWDLEAMMVSLRAIYPVGFTLEELGSAQEINRDELLDRVAADAQEVYKRKEEVFARIEPGDWMRRAERFFLLQSIDYHWREHLDAMEYLRGGIHLRGLAQKDPLVEYRTEGHAMFQAMMREVEAEVVTNLFHFNLELAGPDGQSAIIDAFAEHDDPLAGLVLEHESGSLLEEARAGNGHSPVGVPPDILGTPVEQRRVEHEIGRNDPCWCGSGKKYKRCHGATGTGDA